METQHLTFAVPKPLLRKAELIAGKRSLSLPDLIIELLSECVEQESNYATACQRHLAWLKQEVSLGTNGVISWTREELHERY